ncbi:hypothetical protein DFH08DRAFT_805317 [Mycena albidolilacea]|uniref:Uncharacterized protein n=1 Tax=Mycena albidolilacea TaxID=1033008 RepID=A0AAD7A9C1_9AGAR|nr:hypothetical protein DFH08DRAFT_805317 [Mycena albidolilacea]
MSARMVISSSSPGFRLRYPVNSACQTEQPQFHLGPWQWLLRYRRNSIQPTLFNFGAAKSFAITASEEVTQVVPSVSSASTPATSSKGNSSSTLRLSSTKSSGSTTPTSPNGSPVPSGLSPSSERSSEILVGNRRLDTLLDAHSDAKFVAEIHRRLHDALPREPAPIVIHPSSGSRPIPRIDSEAISRLRERNEVLAAHIRELEANMESQWVLGLSDEPPPRYTEEERQ